MKKQEERRRNIIIRGMKVKERERREAVGDLLKVIGAKAKIKDIKRIGERREMIIVRLKNVEQRKEIMRKKRNLKERRERIMEDWAWRKRKIKWRLEEIARMEKKNRRRV